MNIEEQLIKNLTLFRLKGYDPTTLDTIFSSKDISAIHQLSLSLVKKIMMVEQKNFKDNYIKYESLIDTLDDYPPLDTVIFSSQLLQFYTILCDVDLAKKKSFVDTLNFLSKSTNKYGEYSQNLLILEVV